ncbi:MAG TPA: L-seryl-tRNA(Sec) selenium transferase, partial [Pseudogracilibacillus sp.]|nr:L-seryl-tRNA(Sec) selenium transferase [Pseudogracilibacillus sp.]
LPAIDRLKQDPRCKKYVLDETISESMLTELLQQIVASIRKLILHNEWTNEINSEMEFTNYIVTQLKKEMTDLKINSLQNVINATGVVLHTNLGRAPLARSAAEQIYNVATAYSTLEYDIKTGTRGSRHDIVERYITALTGAEAALVVNNNAAAVYFVLKAFAKGKEVIVSRGELVEIGGSFRISSIMEESGATLVEIGTTNKTHLADYEQALTEETALILKVHKSNFALIGFTEEVDTTDLRQLATKRNVPIYEDLGSGTLFDFKRKQIGSEPTVQEKVRAGIDLISFSGDKLLGGPQAGIIVGKKVYIDKLKKHQLLRVLRVDKFTLASLEATLKLYMNERAKEVPTVRAILADKESIYEKARYFVDALRTMDVPFRMEIVEATSMIGGGTMPEVELPTYVVKVFHETLTSDAIARTLREHAPPIITRVREDAVLFDFRTVNKKEIELIVEACKNLGNEV